VVSVAAAELKTCGGVPDDLITKVKKQIPFPTLGSWLAMASELSQAVLRILGTKAIVPELWFSMRDVLHPLVTGCKEGETDKPNADESVLHLRNQLAHGAGVASIAIVPIIPAHRSRLLHAIGSLAWLRQIRLLAPGEGGRIMILSGIRPRVAENANEFPSDVLKAIGDLKGEVALYRGANLLFLWPLQAYDRPEFLRTRHGENIRGDEPALMVYTRLAEPERLEMTPLSSSLAISELRGPAVKRLEELFRLREKRLFIGHTPDDFKEEFASQAESLVGRAEICRTIIEAVSGSKQGILLLHGSPGTGKSAIMAAVATTLEAGEEKSQLLVAYRFTASNPRSTRSRFLRYAVMRLEKWQLGGASADLGDDPDRLGKRLAELLRRIRPPMRVVFLVDGLDEIARTDPDFTELPFRYQRRGVVWLCAGRPDPLLQRLFTASPCRILFPASGLPGLTDHEVNEWLKRDTPPSQRDAIARMEGDQGSMATWVSNVCRHSSGLPAYITLLLDDIKTSVVSIGMPVPRGLISYFDRLLARAGIDDPATTLPVLLASISLAVEAPDAETLTEVLRRAGHLRPDTRSRHFEIVAEAILRARAMLRTVTGLDGGVNRYLTYHDELAAYLTTTPTLANARALAADGWRSLCLDAPTVASTARRHAFATGIRQLAALGEEEAAVRLYSTLSYHRKRLREGGKSRLLEDLTLVHALASYRRDGLFELYLKFLAHASRESNWRNSRLKPQERRRYAVAFLVRSAGISRRMGAPLVAKPLLENCIRTLGAVVKLSPDALQDLARIEYELGYIEFLGGRQSSAHAMLDHSVQHAELGGDEIGAWIARCVQANFDSQFGITTFDDFESVLWRALNVFITESWNPNADRWVMNVVANQFNIAFFKNDALTAQVRLKELSEHPWIVKFGGPEFLLPYRARMKMLQGDFSRAVKEFELLLYDDGGQPRQDATREGLAREYLDYGYAQMNAGDPLAAQRAWHRGIELPDNCGNRTWKEKIGKLLGS